MFITKSKILKQTLLQPINLEVQPENVQGHLVGNRFAKESVDAGWASSGPASR